MKQELVEWLDRDLPVQLAVLFTAEADRRDTRFALGAVAGLLVLDPPLTAISMVWESHDLRVIVTRLVQKADLLVGDELHHVLDLGLYDATLNALFTALWDARFEHREGNSATGAIEALVQKSFPMPEPATLSNLPWVTQDVALFWLTLAKQNGIIDRVVVWVTLDVAGDSASLLHLHQLILSAERWASLGSPLRLLIGLVEGARVLEQLAGHPLSEKLQESLIDFTPT